MGHGCPELGGEHDMNDSHSSTSDSPTSLRPAQRTMRPTRRDHSEAMVDNQAAFVFKCGCGVCASGRGEGGTAGRC